MGVVRMYWKLSLRQFWLLILMDVMDTDVKSNANWPCHVHFDNLIYLSSQNKSQTP